MPTPNIGDQLNRIAYQARAAIFVQGEIAQLTYAAFQNMENQLKEDQQETHEIRYPIGFTADKTPVPCTRQCTKQELLDRYAILSEIQIAVNGIVHIVTIIEAMFSDILRSVVAKYPHKLGSKRTLTIQSVLEASSLEEVHLKATDSLINELSYKAPTDFAEEFDKLTGIKLLTCPAFHRYVEIKATRDIHIHNRGIANDIYTRKSGSHARVQPKERLPIEIQYFLESYEQCLQLTEWLEQELHDRWHSGEFEERKQSELGPHDATSDSTT